MRKLRKWERYVLFPKTKDNPLEGEIPLNFAQQEIKVHKAWPKPFAFIRPLFCAFTLLFRTTAVSASGQVNPFFGNPSTALRVGFDSLPKNSRSAVEQQSKTSRTTLEEESKRSRRTLEQHPKECRTSLEQQRKSETPRFPRTSLLLSNKVVHSCPKHVLPTRQVCVKYMLSTDIVLNEHSTKALISAVRWPHAMAILYKIAGIFKAIAHKNSTSTIQNLYYANTTDRDNTLPGTYQVRPASDRHGFSTASRRLRAPMAIGARSDNDQSAKPEKQNKGRRKVEQKQNTVRTASEKNAINLRSLYQKATVSIRVTYQKYTLDLLKTYQRLTKKLPTAYGEVGNKWQAFYAKFKNNLHGFSKYCVALWCDNQLGAILITSRYNRSRTLFCQPWAICFVTIVYTCVLFSDAQAQSVETRTVNGQNEITGWVKSHTTHQPIEAVKVKDRETGNYAFTDKFGKFILSVVRTDGQIEINRQGYQPLTTEYQNSSLQKGKQTVWLFREIEQIPQIIVGDTLPDSFWDLAYDVVNHSKERSKLTLYEYQESPLLVLDFWSKFCAPCIKSVEQWNMYKKVFNNQIEVLTVYVGNPDGISDFIESREWDLPAIIGESTNILNAYFFKKEQYGGVVLIKDNKLIAIPETKNLSVDRLKDIVQGTNTSLPLKNGWESIVHSREGGKL
ncbi:redoxin domain-containing protein [Sphingobacterium olei]|uniref:Redoxin domain-containing protein n=1 Tax=Sphingobacterium olei TaxID=2571155 RepID=A0A4U0P6N9_9SPHI|nr:redoxin domain-containing protein [Sphingobacterium olei]TJZ63009.1 redoxin domain-containing protein [Sphingobacterium olei]